MPKLSLAAQRAEDAKLGRKLVERAEAQLSDSVDKGRRVIGGVVPLNKGQHVNIRT